MKIVDWIKSLFKTEPVNRHGKRWTDLELMNLKNALLSGRSDDSIAKQFGRTKRAIQQMRYMEKKKP